MSISTEVVYTDGVTAVTAAWLNLIQEHLAGWVNLQVTASGQVVTIGAAADDDAASVYINGEQRVNEADITFTFTGAEATNTYDVYVVGDGAGPAFTMEVVVGAPVGTNTRKVAEVDYDTTLDVITDLRVLRGRFEEHDHTANSGASAPSHNNMENPGTGDPHTQYMLPDGTRAFTGTVSGIYPTADSHIATKKYADDQLTAGVPVGTVVPYGGSSAPSGWLLCDGTSYLVATYPTLAARLNDVFGGDGGTNFNVPDLRGRFPKGKAAAGSGSTLGGSDGALDHTHTQPTHTHAEVAHSHTFTAHSHSSPTTASGGAHAHTQSSTGSDGGHTHTGPSHSHSVGTLATGSSSGAVVGARNASAATPGLFREDDLDSASDNSSHSHGVGTLQCSTCGTVTGSSASNHFSHEHYPSNNAKEHTHAFGAMSGTSGSAGTGATGSAGAHTHTNPTTSSAGAHTHTIGTTGTALTATQNNTPGTTSAAGGDTTGSANPPFQAVNYIIKAD